MSWVWCKWLAFSTLFVPAEQWLAAHATLNPSPTPHRWTGMRMAFSAHFNSAFASPLCCDAAGKGHFLEHQQHGEMLIQVEADCLFRSVSLFNRTKAEKDNLCAPVGYDFITRSTTIAKIYLTSWRHDSWYVLFQCGDAVWTRALSLVSEKECFV